MLITKDMIFPTEHGPGITLYQPINIGRYTSTHNEKSVCESPVRFAAGLYSIGHIGAFTYFGIDNSLALVDSIGRFCSIAGNIKCGMPEQAYLTYQQHYVDDATGLLEIEQSLQNRKVLVLAPGKTLTTENKVIENFIDDKTPIVISVNFISELFTSDFVFISNLKRFENLEEAYNVMQEKNKSIITSNVSTEKGVNKIIINYSDFTVQDAIVSDNAGLMLLSLLKKCGVSDVYLAGFDGFSEDNKSNYFDKDMVNDIEFSVQKEKNLHIENQLQIILNGMNHEFITTTQYQI